MITGTGPVLMIFTLNNGEDLPRMERTENLDSAKTILSNHLETSPDMVVDFVGYVTDEYVAEKSTVFVFVTKDGVE